MKFFIKSIDSNFAVCYTILERGTEAMKTGEVLRRIMQEAGVSQAKLAAMMGIKNQQTIFNMLRSPKGMRSDNMLKAFDVLGYDVVVRNRVNGEEMRIGSEEQAE